MDTASHQSTAADHLCVLVHGLWGNPQHLEYLAKSLREKYPEDRLHVLVAKRNAGSFTYDGIELGGERVTKEIEETLEHHARNGTEIKKLSIVGYSLGGLVSRYAIGLLYHKGYFDKLEPVNFTTFATPHLGVRTPLVGYHNHIWNVLGARTLSMSGRQLFTIDSFRDTGRPLLSVLADPDSIFIRALSRFRHKSLYANIVNDRSAVYYTTGISRIDPFVDLENIKINYVEGTEQVIIDPDNPISPKEESGSLPAFSTRLTNSTRTILGQVPLIALLTVLIPIGTVIFLINSGFQSVRSRQRIRMHESGKAGIDIGGYRIPLIFDDVRREAEEMFENMNNLQSQEYLPAGSEELASPRSAPSSPTLLRADSSPMAKVTDNSAGDDDSIVEQKQQLVRSLEFPTLALTPDQFAMIQALDDVGFRKYPVYIHNHRHSHAAIIVRMDKPAFGEGRIVVEHWLSEFAI
ncbi:lipase/serine esteras-like protein [Mytilinidion resinicola]|uniref:Lipase/serine esteras-like protein n=1 Tax=Mytilinidion resinicola TaxID=574789 RepID=A0A6A6Z8M1_9PEZI|nr:lipase/serine esteras-like protein [Mytilinidion resinicola]KAF2817356.1 lipase/serine esteras-like protein [Mytilinidion resinicola]